MQALPHLSQALAPRAPPLPAPRSPAATLSTWAPCCTTGPTPTATCRGRSCPSSCRWRRSRRRPCRSGRPGQGGGVARAPGQAAACGPGAPPPPPPPRAAGPARRGSTWGFLSAAPRQGVEPRRAARRQGRLDTPLPASAPVLDGAATGRCCHWAGSLPCRLASGWCGTSWWRHPSWQTTGALAAFDRGGRGVGVGVGAGCSLLLLRVRPTNYGRSSRREPATHPALQHAPPTLGCLG